MTNYNVAAFNVGVHKRVTSANVVDTVTFTRNAQSVEVISDGAADLYFTVDGSTPTVGGNNTRRLPAGIITAYTQFVPSRFTATVVSLISSGAVTYTVTAEGGTS